MESQKTLEELTRQMDEAVAEFETIKPKISALGDIELVVSFEDLKARFGPPTVPMTTAIFNAVRV